MTNESVRRPAVQRELDERLLSVSLKVAMDDEGKKTYRPEGSKANQALAFELFGMSSDPMGALAVAVQKEKAAKAEQDKAAAAAAAKAAG